MAVQGLPCMGSLGSVGQVDFRPHLVFSTYLSFITWYVLHKLLNNDLFDESFTSSPVVENEAISL